MRYNYQNIDLFWKGGIAGTMNNNRLLTIVSAGVIILSVLAGAGLALLTGGASTPLIERPSAQDAADFSVTICQGRLPGAEEYPTNEEGTGFLYTINTVVTANRAGLGSIMLENTPGNQCDIEMEFTLDDTGETIYRSPRLKPNTCFTQDMLAQTPGPGSYNVSASIMAYDIKTGEQLATKTRYITLTVTEQ